MGATGQHKSLYSKIFSIVVKTKEMYLSCVFPHGGKMNWHKSKPYRIFPQMKILETLLQTSGKHSSAFWVTVHRVRGEMIHDIPTVFSSCQQRSRVAHLEKAAEVVLLLPSPTKLLMKSYSSLKIFLKMCHFGKMYWFTLDIFSNNLQFLNYKEENNWSSVISTQ